MTARAPNMSEKLAATLLAWLDALGAPIPREHAQLMTAHQICSLFEFDHYPVRRADGGTNHPDNLLPRLIAAHAIKTAKIDVPQISKRKRIVRRANDSAVNRLLRRDQPAGETRRVRKPGSIPSRPFQKGHRPLRSRNSFERRP